MSLTSQQCDDITKLMVSVISDKSLSVKKTGELINGVIPGSLTEKEIEAFEKKQFNPDQPRDANGQFASVGGGSISGSIGGGGSKHKTVASAMSAAKNVETHPDELDDLVKHPHPKVRYAAVNNDNLKTETAQKIFDDPNESPKIKYSAGYNLMRRKLGTSTSKTFNDPKGAFASHAVKK